MQTRTGTGRGWSAGQAFTLVELLLSITLLMLLIAALVFNFAGMRRGAELQQGETQVEGLLRFARGYAASSGRLVQLRLTNEVSEGTNLVFSMTSELDPIRSPGFFEPVFEAAPYLEQIAGLVSVTSLRLLAETEPEMELANATNTVVQAAAPEDLSPAISFFPDGSSDSAEIKIISRDEEDMRTIALTLRGEIGQVTYRYVSDDFQLDEMEEPRGEQLP